MSGEDIQSWSTTAATNSTADTSINWAEGQPRASVNNSARSMMAAHAKDRDLKNGSITTGGTANAQTFTSGVSYTTVPTGLWVKLKIGVTNTGATTLDMDGIGAVTIKDQSGGDLSAGALTIGHYIDLIYNGTNWLLLQSAGATTVPQCGRLTLASATALSFAPYNGNLIKINGAIAEIPSAGITGLGNTGVYVNGVAGQNLTGDNVWWVCVFNNAGVLTADFVSFATGHTTSTTAGNIGTQITGDDTRTLLGLVRTTVAGQFRDDGAFRGVLSWFNRRGLSLTGASTAGATTASAVLVELTTAARVYFLTWSDEAVKISFEGAVISNSIGAGSNWNIGLDGVAPAGSQQGLFTHYDTNAWTPAALSWSTTVSEGAHYLTVLGAQQTVTTGTFYIVITGITRG